jgi:hypothetical protein
VEVEGETGGEGEGGDEWKQKSEDQSTNKLEGTTGLGASVLVIPLLTAEHMI